MNKEQENELRLKYRELKSIVQDRGWHKDTFFVMGIIAGSKQMHLIYEDTVVALAKVIEIVKKCDTSEECISKIMELAHIEV